MKWNEYYLLNFHVDFFLVRLEKCVSLIEIKAYEIYNNYDLLVEEIWNNDSNIYWADLFIFLYFRKDLIVFQYNHWTLKKNKKIIIIFQYV